MSDPLVCVIDHDKSPRLSLRQDLECSGFQVRDFDSPGKVMERLDPLFDGVTLSDVCMPGMDRIAAHGL